ncbi:zinc finger BED domain-containing protein RICESLEEPER 2-like protein [Tanacetum coccineum]
MASEFASASTATGVGSTTAPTIHEIIATNQNPQIWKDFNICIMTDNSQNAQCKHCFHFLSVGSNTTLRNHVTHPHCEAKKAQQNQNSEAGQTSMARYGSVISRFTLKRDAMKLWLAAKQEIIDSFGNINACVNLTTDVWSSLHGVPGSYMCVTAHWIEPGTWQRMKRVISFEEFSSPHTGGALFKMLTKVLTNFNLKDKVMSITLDNASNNTSAMDKLKLKYEPPMGGRFYHSRCVAHIINLVVQAGLEVPAIDAIRESFKTMLKDIFKSSARTRQRYVKICKDAEKPCLRPMKKKLRKYFQHMPPIITCAVALNPCFNVNGVDFLIESISTDFDFFDDTFASKLKSYFKESLEGLYNLYYEKYGNPTQSSQTSGGATSSKASGGNKYSRLLNGLKAHTKKGKD